MPQLHQQKKTRENFQRTTRITPMITQSMMTTSSRSFLKAMTSCKLGCNKHLLFLWPRFLQPNLQLVMAFKKLLELVVIVDWVIIGVILVVLGKFSLAFFCWCSCGCGIILLFFGGSFCLHFGEECLGLFVGNGEIVSDQEVRENSSRFNLPQVKTNS